MFRTAFQQYCFQNALGLHPSICLNLNEETILKRQRTPTVYTIVMQNSIFDTDKRFKINWTNSLGIHQLFITRSWFCSPEVALKFL